MPESDFDQWETEIPWSPLHLLPLVWFDPSTMDEPITGNGTA